MKSLFLSGARALALCGLACAIGAGCPASAQTPNYSQSSQAQAPKAAPGAQAPEAERQAAMKIAAAADYTAALAATAEFVKKFPKSTLRPEIARRMAAKAASTPDAATQITNLEGLLATLKEPEEAETINTVLIDSYIKAEKYDDAFRIGASMIEKNPNDLITTAQLAIVGFDQVKRNNPKYVTQSMQYGTKAIEMIETDKRPAGLEDAQWNEYKTKWLAQLYQSMGVGALMTRNPADAKVKLDKSVAINPFDPITYVYLGSISLDEYTTLAQKVKGMLPGKEQDELLKKTLEKLDQVIDHYARAVGLSEGNPPLQKLHDELLTDLKTYYAFRNKNSTDGLQQLIDKYKKPQ